MKVYGVEIAQNVFIESVNYIGGALTAKRLSEELEKRGVPRFEGFNYVSIAAASRIIQKLQKENKIKCTYGKGGPNALYKLTGKKLNHEQQRQG